MGFNFRRVALPAALALSFGAGLFTGTSRLSVQAAGMAVKPTLVHYADVVAGKWQGVATGVKVAGISQDAKVAFGVVQIGTVGKHTHHGSTEYGYVVSGAASGWLGDKAVNVKAGDLMVIPPDTPHAFKAAPGDPFRLVMVITPPIADKDMHMIK